MLRARLRVVTGKHRGKTIPILGSKFLIGREHDCQLRPNSELVSRHHCAISVDPFTVRLRDLASTNGTYVNEQRIQGQVTLKAGDVVRVGKLRFEMLITQISEEEARRQAGSGAATALANLVGDRTGSDTSELSDSETSHEIPLPLITGGSGDSGAFELNEPASQPQPVFSDSALRSLPNGSDTTIASQHSLVPLDPSGGAGHQPYPPMPYNQPPQYMPASPYPAMPPQYYQPPMPYNPYNYGYPPQGMYAPPPYPTAQPPVLLPQPLADEPEEPVSKTPSSAFPQITLPDPSKTGVRPVPPPPPKAETEPKADDAPAPPPKTNPSEEAANIIRQHMQRRPGA